MEVFSYLRAPSIADAAAATRPEAGERRPAVAASAQVIAGGTNMTDYMKLGVARPRVVVDIDAIDDKSLRDIVQTSSGLRLGALVRMADAQDHPAVRSDYPVVAEALALSASQQIRNMASLGGNLLQRTRCEYFRETSWACNKRDPGTGCAAIGGINREHAVLGVSDHCIAAYPGDLGQALIMLDASVETVSATGRRTIPLADLHLRPEGTPHIETVLEPGELIVAIDIPSGAPTRRSHYVKIRDRQSYQFALASAAVCLDMDGDRVRAARIALGGVATVPWRAREAEAELAGQILDEAAAQRAAAVAFRGARPHQHNAFKVALGQATLVRALLETKAMPA